MQSKLTLFLLALLLAMACTISNQAQVMVPALAPTAAPATVIPPTLQAVIVRVTPEPTLFLRTFTVMAETLWIRDSNDDRVGYFSQGQAIACSLLKSGWCMLERGRRVWSGCLDPNPMDLGCEQR
jgi:hypothetical protein